ncbi:MAG: hypothetical protein K2N56_01945 [Oscillospiraceae bacterium]|nr:hypothetical protein [Oscillospiraceae bacterium]
MPFINVKYSSEITPEQETSIKSALGSAVSAIGKTESWLMVGFEKNVPLYFKGEKSEKIAFVEVSLYGSAPKQSYDKLTSEICSILGKDLGVPSDKVYVKYSPTDNWGWNGGNF